MFEFKGLESSYPGKRMINFMRTMRAKVPGGWLVVVAYGQGGAWHSFPTKIMSGVAIACRSDVGAYRVAPRQLFKASQGQGGRVLTRIMHEHFDR